MNRDCLKLKDFSIFLEHAVTGNTTIDTCAFEDDNIGFCFYGSGNVELHVAHGNKRKGYLNTKGLAMSFFANQNTEFIHTVSAEKPLRCVVVCYPLKNLQKLPAQEKELYHQYLKHLLHPVDDFVEGPRFFMSPTMQTTIDKIFSTSYTGTTRMLFLKSQITELLSHFLAKISSDIAPENGLKNVDREKLYQAKAILSENMDNPPSLTELSKLVGLNDFKLKKSFKELFGFPVYKFLQQERLNKAHELLENSDQTVQEVAWSVGYESLSSFSNAFIKKFGIRPSGLKQ